MAFFSRWFHKHSKDGLERPDPTPIEVPLVRPLTLAEQIARFVAAPDLVAAVTAQGGDTFDEANDFDVSDGEPDGDTLYQAEAKDDALPLQTRLDEARAGITEEMPVDRFERASERIRKGSQKPEPAQPAAGKAAGDGPSEKA